MLFRSLTGSVDHRGPGQQPVGVDRLSLRPSGPPKPQGNEECQPPGPLPGSVIRVASFLAGWHPTNSPVVDQKDDRLNRSPEDSEDEPVSSLADSAALFQQGQCPGVMERAGLERGQSFSSGGAAKGKLRWFGVSESRNMAG